MKNHFIEVIINNAALAKLYGVTPGAAVRVQCKNNIPVNLEWRNRFKDMTIDNCISLVESKTIESKKSSKKGGD